MKKKYHFTFKHSKTDFLSTGINIEGYDPMMAYLAFTAMFPEAIFIAMVDSEELASIPLSRDREIDRHEDAINAKRMEAGIDIGKKFGFNL